MLGRSSHPSFLPPMQALSFIIMVCMLITNVLREFLSNSFPGWKLGDIRLELKERTLRIVCEDVETQRQIVGDSSTLSKLDIGVDLFLVCCTGYPSLGIHHRAHHA